MSTDGGQTFPFVLSATTTNDGTESVTIPNVPASTTARVKVESVGNIFFDIGNTNFTITAAANGFTFNSIAPASVACGSASASTTLATASQGGFITPINLTASGNPAGTTVSFSVNPLVPGNSTSITLNNMNLLAPGDYNVTINGVAGTVSQTGNVTFTVQPGAPLVIANQPAGVTVCAGSNASFTVVPPAPGVGFTYQWQVSTGGGPFTDIAGATAATYTATAVTNAENNNQYQVIVSSLCSSATSTAATLVVNSAPSITAQPANATVCVGSSNTFSVGAAGGGLTYQWQVSTDGCITFTDIPSATGPTFVLSGITIGMNNNSYRVIVNGACPGPATSNCAVLFVGNAPSITLQPVNVTACAGNTATFTVDASGSGIGYQWQVSTDGGVTFNDIPGETNASLNLTGVTAAANNNVYMAVVSSATCATPSNSNTATLTVNDLPAITTQPSDATLCAGSDVSFTSAATGTGISYQWQVSTDGGTTYTDIAGATAATYDITGVTAGLNNNQYQVVVSGICTPAATSTAAILTVISPVSISAQPASLAACAGTNASITVGASSPVAINYQWQVSTDGGTTYTDIAGEISATLSLAAVTAGQDGNLYHVLVSNNTCTTPVISGAATLTVNALPAVTAAANANNVCTGTPVVLTAGGAGGAGTYTWAPVGLTGETVTVNPVLTNPSVSETFTYTVTGTDGNSCQNTASVSVTANPLPVVTLTADPADTRLLPGRTVVLTATVTPGTGFTFTWEKNGVVIPGFNGSTLVATVEDIGAYQVTATDANGFCSSRSSLVTVADSVTNHVFIYPNPSNGVFTVSYYNVRRNGNQVNAQNITVYDTRGARVYSKTFDVAPSAYPLLKVDLRPIASGAYIVVLNDGYGNRIAAERIFVH